MEENILLTIFLLLPILFGIMAYHFIRGLDPRRRKRIGWFNLVTGNLLILLLLGSILLAAGEIYYRFFYDTTDAFGLARVTRDWFDRHYHYNQLGFRDSIEFAFDRPPEKRRVTFVGDSFTAAHGIPDVGDRFSNLIRAMRPQWDVQVLATNGFDTGQELELLQRLIVSHYGFDQLVLVYCLNDIADIVPEWPAVQQRIYGSPTPGFLVDHSYLANTLYYRVKSARDPEISRYYDFVLDAYRGSLWQNQERRLAAFKALVETGGGRLLAVTFPFMHELDPESEYRAVHEQLDQLWQRLGVPHLDLLPLFAEHSAGRLTVSNRDPHPNERAHRLAAEAIAAFLDREMDGSP
jgi:lysophospholipase L1-like esterase